MARSVRVAPWDGRSSPRLCKSGVKQRLGAAVLRTEYRSPTGTRITLPGKPQGSQRRRVRRPPCGEEEGAPVCNTSLSSMPPGVPSCPAGPPEPGGCSPSIGPRCCAGFHSRSSCSARGQRPWSCRCASRLILVAGPPAWLSYGRREQSGDVVWAAELSHRGEEIHQALVDRHAVRRARRQRHTRYRAARFANRTRPRGWLPPSLESRVQNVVAWVQRLARWSPIAALSLEAVRFDTQLLQNPDIAGIAYQHGTLAGTEIREYLLLTWGYRCAYCHQEATATNPWEIDHVDPTTRGGSDRASNLALSCHDCNQAKGNRTAQEFGHPEVQALAKAPSGMRQRSIAPGAPCTSGCWHLGCRWRRPAEAAPNGTVSSGDYPRPIGSMPSVWVRARLSGSTAGGIWCRS